MILCLHRAQAQWPQASGHTRGQDRGAITDINGVPLAFDTFRWEVWIEPRLVPKGSELELAADLVELLGPTLSLTPDELVRTLQAHEPGIVMLTRQGSQAAGETIASWKRLDIGAKALPVRYYPQGSLAAHLLGFVNGEPRAYYGIEERYDGYLRSMSSSFFHSYPENQAFYQQLPEGWRETLPSHVGQDLVLTIDRRVQYITERVLSEAIGQYQAESGTIIVMDPRTGAILAMASLPAYDPNQYGATNTQVLADPAISKQYEPGSVFKIVTMAAGIDAGIITPDTVLTDTLSIEVGDRQIYNSIKRSYGPVTIRQALVLSLEHSHGQGRPGAGRSPLLPVHPALRLRPAHRDRPGQRGPGCGQGARRQAVEPLGSGHQRLRPGPGRDPLADGHGHLRHCQRRSAGASPRGRYHGLSWAAGAARHDASAPGDPARTPPQPWPT